MSQDIQARADQLAQLMDDFRLEEARLEGDDWKVAFRKRAKVKQSTMVQMGSAMPAEEPQANQPAEVVVDSTPRGLPVSSPMTGIYYAAPSPSAPPFVKEGESVNAGQVVGLIEAMKVFNEIVAPQAGIVLKVVARSGEIVNPGEPLLYIG